MAFWDTVSLELEYLGMTNKALAEKVGIAASNIGKGIRQKSSPSADTAVKIANILGVSVEYLVTGTPEKSSEERYFEERRKYQKYSEIIDDLEVLPDYEREPIIQMIIRMKAKK
ncbi:MAG: helix-turn-helix transcriptional regulator [Treponema sp.]|nr:helix-turn-helix transcriptional regulator [Treponema sp.]